MITEEQYKLVAELIDKILDKKPIIKDDRYISTLQLGFELEKQLLESVRNNKFEMVYQPKFYNGKETKSAEALFRTKEAFRIRPDVAFTLFKLFGDEKEVVLKQLEVVARDTAKFKENINPNYRVSMNIAIDCIDEAFIKKLDQVVKKNNLNYRNVGIEILESENFDNLKNHMELIQQLHDRGALFAIDDFGSRNATDKALDIMDFDIIKIDAHFLKYAESAHDYSKIKELEEKIEREHPNSTIVVEGVETREDVDELSSTGIDQIYQGYYFSKPLTADQLLEKYSQKQPEPGE